MKRRMRTHNQQGLTPQRTHNQQGPTPQKQMKTASTQRTCLRMLAVERRTAVNPLKMAMEMERTLPPGTGTGTRIPPQLRASLPAATPRAAANQETATKVTKMTKMLAKMLAKMLTPMMTKMLTKMMTRANPRATPRTLPRTLPRTVPRTLPRTVPRTLLRRVMRNLLLSSKKTCLKMLMKKAPRHQRLRLRCSAPELWTLIDLRAQPTVFTAEYSRHDNNQLNCILTSAPSFLLFPSPACS